ncbi:uncharacterized protein LOC129790333 [Lutzomyia longipalpis]|uniref:uncharacterized protein LOC129790333 n=1 Tax=Lutzomyia longipalpis TaxID=7200 RepID=UPI0024837F1C|nr:uncharacterized protein LOC129790333 [Lutzomyia longipalpis]
MEMKCPAARLATAEAWVEHLESLKRNDIVNDLHDDPFAIQMATEPQTTLTGEKDDLFKIALQLGIISNARKAFEQEEFLAKVSAKSMQITNDQLHMEMIQHAQQRVDDLRQEYGKLRMLYEEQDGLWASVTGGTYTSGLEERLEQELSEARQIRDRLVSVAEQWRTSGALLHAATKCSQQVIQYWNLIPLARRADDKLSLALDCRHALQAAIKAYEGAQTALPQAEIIRNRHLTSVRNASQYLLTDMVNERRYKQSSGLFEAFQETLSTTTAWLQETFTTTLGADIRESETLMVQLAKRLRQERLKYISTNYGNRIYLPRKSATR